MSMSAGLATSVLAGHSTPDRAQAVIDYHLRRLFPPGSRGLRREGYVAVVRSGGLPLA
jgi:hypothetical protein